MASTGFGRSMTAKGLGQFELPVVAFHGLDVGLAGLPFLVD